MRGATSCRERRHIPPLALVAVLLATTGWACSRAQPDTECAETQEVRLRTIITATTLAATLPCPPAAAAAAPTLRLSAPSAAPGAVVGATGTGFPRLSPGRLEVGTTEVARFTTSRRGGFSTRFVVPTGTSGTVTVRAVVGRSAATAPLRVDAPAAAGVWAPAVGAAWQWQLEGPLDTSVDVPVYDVDAFDTPASTVAALKAAGRRVICYVSVGTFEEWRPDAGSFPPQVLGEPNGWPGERWLDIRALDVIGPIIERRFDLCAAKGFDAVEPDNVDGYANATGFPLTADDQLRFNRWVAAAAHARGLGVALKNDVEQAGALVGDFDFAINEECARYDECELLRPFLDAGKAVLHVEYDLPTASFCGKVPAGFSSMRKHRSLDAWREPCP